MRHFACARTQHPPGNERAQNGVAQAGPKRRQAVFPAELACVSHEDNGAEVAGAEGESAHPGAHVSSAQNKAVNAISVLAAVNAHAYGHAEEDDN